MSEFYASPLCRRYAGDEMKRIFSDDRKFSTWRRLWLALAEEERALGLPITEEQVAEMRAHLDDIDYALAAEFERELRHDVMAHIHTFGTCCPTARPIIHLGATSCYVGDNTDMIVQRDALLRVRGLLVYTAEVLCRFAEAHRALPCLAFTHFQAAQPTTVGKRAALWLHDLMTDLAQVEFVLGSLKLPGCKGTTGTGASFLALFDGDGGKVRALEQGIARRMGFGAVYPVSGQTYSRKADYQVLSALSGIAQSACKISNDIRLLSHLKEAEEPFEPGQVGSSAMAYKRNPMRSERIAALARYVMVDALNPALTAAGQWLERTLDDSANRRIAIPEAFLAVDGILSLLCNVIGGLTLFPKVMDKHLREELPFLATENILMACVRRGGDRQTLHESIRTHSLAAARQVKEGGENDLLARILADPAFGLRAEELDEMMDPARFTGLAEEQTAAFAAEVREQLKEYGPPVSPSGPRV